MEQFRSSTSHLSRVQTTSKLRLKQIPRFLSNREINAKSIRHCSPIRPETRIRPPKYLGFDEQTRGFTPLLNSGAYTERLTKKEPFPMPDDNPSRSLNWDSKRSWLKKMTRRHSKISEPPKAVYYPVELLWSKKSIRGILPQTRVKASLINIGPKAFLYGGECRSKFTDVFSMNLNTYRWERVSNERFKESPEQRTGELVLAYNNFLLVHGGSAVKIDKFHERKCFITLYMFDTLKKEWANYFPKGIDPTARRYHSGAILGSELFIYGGQDVNGRLLNDIQCLDIENRRWTDVVIVPKTEIPALYKFTATLVFPKVDLEKQQSFYDMKDVYNYKYKQNNVGIYIFGGQDGAQTPQNKVYLIRGRRSKKGRYIGNCAIWEEIETVGKPPEPRHSHNAQFIDPYLYICFGRNDRNRYATPKYTVQGVSALNIMTMNWDNVRVHGNPPENRWCAASCNWNDQIIIFGGMKIDRMHNAKTYVLDTNRHRVQGKVSSNPQMHDTNKKIAHVKLSSVEIAAKLIRPLIEQTLRRPSVIGNLVDVKRYKSS